MAFLLDTNVLSELRKGDRANHNVKAWAKENRSARTYVSVLSIGEIRKDIDRQQAKDPQQCPPLERWLTGLKEQYQDDILPITVEIVDRWGQLNARRPMPVIDSLIAATALEHQLTVVSRNKNDFIPTKIPVINPFQTQ